MFWVPTCFSIVEADGNHRGLAGKENGPWRRINGGVYLHRRANSVMAGFGFWRELEAEWVFSNKQTTTCFFDSYLSLYGVMTCFLLCSVGCWSKYSCRSMALLARIVSFFFFKKLFIVSFISVSSSFSTCFLLYMYCSYDLNSTIEEREAVKTQKRLDKIFLFDVYIYIYMVSICM